MIWRQKYPSNLRFPRRGLLTHWFPILARRILGLLGRQQFSALALGRYEPEIPKECVTHVFTLVHGTFAQNADWTTTDSPLRRRLLREFKSVRFEPYSWNGWNTMSARVHAARGLRKHLGKVADQYPNATRLVIAHSHGGNIALQAIGNGRTLSSVHGFAGLATPFLAVVPRNLGGKSLTVNASLAIVSVWSYWLIRKLVFLQVPRLIALSAVTISVIAILAAVATVVERLSRTANTTCRHVETRTGLTSEQVLILRVSGDEASASVAAAHFVSWLASSIVALVSKRLLTVWTIVGGFIADFAPVVVPVLVVFGLKTLREMPPSEAWHLVRDPFFAGSIPVWISFFLMIAFLPATLSIGLALLCAPVLVLCALAIGPEFANASPFYQVSSEQTPVGGWQLHRLAGTATEGLRHSDPYNDERALDELVRWVKARRPIAK